MAEDNSNIKQLSEYLDLNLDRDWKEVKADLDKSYIKLDSDKPQNTVLQIESNHPELHKAMIGKYSGSTKHQLKKLANDLGVEITWSELEDAKSTEVIDKIRELATEKVGSYQTQLTDLEQRVKDAQKSGASAKDIEAAQKQVDEWKQKYEDTNQLLEGSVKELEDYKKTQEETTRINKIKETKEKVYGSVKLKTNSDWEKNGFIQDIESKYQLDVDGDEVVVRDKEGKRVPNPEKHGSFMSYADVVKTEAAKAKLLDESPHTGKPAYTPPVPTPNRDNGAPKKHEILHPSMRGK